jgi:hypothetical protein
MIALILYSVIHLLEAWLEQVVIDMKNGTSLNYDRLNHTEHFRSALLSVAWFTCFLSAIVALQFYWLIPAFVVNRRIFFDYTLIIFRHRPAHKYEGDDWWVKRIVKVFGKNGRVKELLVELLITAVCIAIHLHETKTFY